MKWVVVGLAALLGAIAIAIAVAFCHVKSQITYGLDFGSLIDAFALLLIGFFLEFAYLKRSSEKRADTDLLLGIVDDAKSAFRMLTEKAQPYSKGATLNELQKAELLSAEREFSNAVHSIEQALKHCGVDLHRLSFDKLKDARAALKDDLTDTPFPGPYDAASIAQITRSLKATRDELTRMAFAINRR
jgi:hypothetical protein